MSTPRGRSVSALHAPSSSSVTATGTSKKSPKILQRLSLAGRNNSGSSLSGSGTKKRSGSFRLLSSVRGRRRSMAAPLDSSPTQSIMMQEEEDDDDESLDSSKLNIIEWLEKKCPQDVVPKVMAYAGPQKTAALAKTNRHWNAVVQKEGTWRILCEELYKWKPGDPEPESWAELYRLSPCVPVDFRSVHKAFAIATGDDQVAPNRRTQRQTQTRSVRILLRPGKYYLKEAITVRAMPGVKLSFETMELPKNVFQPTRAVEFVEQAPEAPAPPRRSGSLRSLMRCHRPEAVDETEFSESSAHSEDWMNVIPKRPKCASLVLRTRRHNEPAFCIRQGSLALKDIEIQHNSLGLDIWNGNAAVQIQPPLGEDEHPVRVDPRPSVELDGVQVTSRSGRGIVNIDGGMVVIRNCAIHDCAATGVYIGGPGSEAHMEGSDVVRNGTGNRSRRGIARGHSGIYLEQGLARVLDCNISTNTLTGISAVSPENAILSLERSDLTANGTYQLEMPPVGTTSRQRSLTQNNKLSVLGTGRPRTGFLTEESSTTTTLLG